MMITQYCVHNSFLLPSSGQTIEHIDLTFNVFWHDLDVKSCREKTSFTRVFVYNCLCNCTVTYLADTCWEMLLEAWRTACCRTFNNCSRIHPTSSCTSGSHSRSLHMEYSAISQSAQKDSPVFSAIWMSLWPTVLLLLLLSSTNSTTTFAVQYYNYTEVCTYCTVLYCSTILSSYQIRREWDLM